MPPQSQPPGGVPGGGEPAQPWSPSGGWGQQPAYQPQPGYPPRQPPEAPGRDKPWLLPLVGVLALGVVGAAVWFSGLLGGEEEVAGGPEVPTLLEPGQILLEPASAIGPSPVSTTNLAGTPDARLAQPPASEVTEIPVTDQVQVRAVVGTNDGVYRGLEGLSGCNRDGVAAALAADPGAAVAFAGALQQDPDLRAEGGRPTPATLGAYVQTLTPLTLGDDVRVTNHATTAEGVVERQSVLQAGTAVLVDPVGLPRVRCASATLLLPPRPADRLPTYIGTAWPGFQSAEAVQIEPADEPVEAFTFTDLASGDGVARPVGTTGAEDGAGGVLLVHAEGGFALTVPADHTEFDFFTGLSFDEDPASRWYNVVAQPPGSSCLDEGGPGPCVRVRLIDDHTVEEYMALPFPGGCEYTEQQPYQADGWIGVSTTGVCTEFETELQLIVARDGRTVRLAVRPEVESPADVAAEVLSSIDLDVPAVPAGRIAVGPYTLSPPPGFSDVRQSAGFVEMSTDLEAYLNTDGNTPFASFSARAMRRYPTPAELFDSIDTGDFCDLVGTEPVSIGGFTGTAERSTNCGDQGTAATFDRYALDARGVGGFLFVTGNDTTAIEAMLQSVEYAGEGG